jgi:BirA family biotin operon repressor/biotin-[acetyl-CoA-carboxylase] ligase
MLNTDNEYKRIESSTDACSIIKALIDASGDHVSGSLLAESLGISRPAIHGKLEKLRDQGFTIEAIRNRGYRISKLPEVLHPSLLRHELDQLGCELPVLYYPVIDSTNNEAERQLTHGRKGPFAVTSSCQTKGRGRLGRTWQSGSADNLYLSVLFEPNIPAQQLQHFTLWAGIHICRALKALTPKAPLKIKWPNDLHCEGRKFAGMLTEAKMDADGIRSIVFGVGINVNSNPTQFPAEIRTLATSLYAIHGEELPLNTVAAVTLKAITAAYDACIQGTSEESLPEAWAPLNALEGKSVTALRGNTEITGIAGGIDVTGALLIETPNGVEAIRAGDVTLKKNIPNS